ncbi:acetylcholinesterase-1-like [Amblyomma americanum]
MADPSEVRSISVAANSPRFSKVGTPKTADAVPPLNDLQSDANEERSVCSLYQACGCHISLLCLLVMTVAATATLVRVTQGAALTKYPDADILVPITEERRAPFIERHSGYAHPSNAASTHRKNEPDQSGRSNARRDNGPNKAVRTTKAASRASSTTSTTAARHISASSALAKTYTSRNAGTPTEKASKRRRRKAWVVKTTHGLLVGMVADVGGKEVAVFRGIPYAAKMTQKDRFQAPKPAGLWNRTFKAYSDGPSCLQPEPTRDHPMFSAASQSENCLYLNMWVPLCGDRSSECTRKTVVVYFHGGNLLRGSNSMPIYDGAVLSAMGQVIVAVPNYRLGVFGFLSRKVKGTRSNVGLLDQVHALDWVFNNSEAFGGRREDLVVFGHDWGAYTASLFLISPALKRFHVTKAILGSGSPILAPRFTRNDSQWEGFLKSLGCGQHFFDSTLSCLQKARAEKLLAAQSRFPGSVGVYHPHPMLPRLPDQFLRLEHNLSGVQLLLTSTSLEGLGVFYEISSKIGHTDTLSPEELLAKVGVQFRNGTSYTPYGFKGEVHDRYEIPPSSAEYGTAFAVSFLGDVLFNCPTTLFARRMCQLGADAFHFVIGQKPRFWNPTASFQSRASHLDDVYFVFGVPVSHYLNYGNRSSPSETAVMTQEAGCSKRIIRIVSDFAKNGASAQAVTDFLRPYCDSERSTEMFRGLRPVPSWRTKQCEVHNKYLRYL